MPKDREPRKLCPYRNSSKWCRLDKNQEFCFPPLKEGQSLDDYSKELSSIVRACFYEQDKGSRLIKTPIDAVDRFGDL
jgi:hypothetical protein